MGRAILYADKITGSIERTIEETDRRREIQKEYNQKNSITPVGITKKVSDVMEGARSVKGKTKTRAKLDKMKNLDFGPIESLGDPVALRKEITRVEDLMYKYAKDLEFEEAAKIRDELHQSGIHLIMS